MIMNRLKPYKTDEKRLCELEAALCRLQKQNVVQVTADYSAKLGDRLLVLNTAGANVADVTLPDPTKHKGRVIDIVNFSGASQNILSHNGTSLTIKNITGPAVATSALENATSTSTGRRSYRSDGLLWILTSI